jgi:di/tricarboxylate transporter
VDHATVSFAVLAAVVALFIWNHLPVELVAVAAALALFATGVLELDETLAGFGDPMVIFIAALFVVSEGLDATGVTTWAGAWLIALAGPGGRRLLVAVMAMCALLTALISINGAVAALLPIVVVAAIRLGRPTSQLLLPLAFAAHAGSLLALTGTPVNVIVSEAAENADGEPFAYLEFSLVGVPLVLGTIAITLLFGRRLLPRRTPKALPADLGAHARTLMSHYLREDDIFKLQADAGSPLVGAPRAGLDLHAGAGVTLVGVLRDGGDGPAGEEQLASGDVLIVQGAGDAVSRLAADQRLAILPRPEPGDLAATLLNRTLGAAEIVLPPRSSLIGETVFPGMVTASGDLVVLAVQRSGGDLEGEVVLAAGDSLLLRGTWDALERNAGDPGVLLVDHPELVRRQAVPMGPRARRSLIVLALMIVALATGVVPPSIAALGAAFAIVALRILTPQQAYRSVAWTTVVLIAAMIPLSTAMQTTGAAEQLASLLVDVVGGAGPHILLIGLFVLTATLGQIISNSATALIVIPIAVSAAAELDVSPRLLLMTVAVAAAAAFLTPVATPVNLMVMEPGGYRFGDYWKLGLPLLAWFGVVAVVLVPLIWAF